MTDNLITPFYKYILRIFHLRILTEPSVPSEAHDAEERFAEDAATHLAGALAAIDKHDGHLLNLTTNLLRGELHLYLEGIAFETYLIQFDGLEHATAVTLEARCGVVYLETRHHAYVL